ncbi:MAG: helix-turn-helix domain-containing protein [Sedimentisphaerales bacterium]|nr:helix-turn-helix domain-containing protein [Sedimentisphaerales bacterium]
MRGAEEHFGNYLKSLRLKAGFGLRRFASLIEMKASNLCDIEHDRRAMPKEYLEPVADALGLEQASPEWEKFFELARKDDEIPADLKKVTQRKLVPALLRTIDNVQLSDEEIKKLIEDIQGRRIKENESR